MKAISYNRVKAFFLPTFASPSVNSLLYVSLPALHYVDGCRDSQRVFLLRIMNISI